MIIHHIVNELSILMEGHAGSEMGEAPAAGTDGQRHARLKCGRVDIRFVKVSVAVLVRPGNTLHHCLKAPTAHAVGIEFIPQGIANRRNVHIMVAVASVIVIQSVPPEGEQFLLLRRITHAPGGVNQCLPVAVYGRRHQIRPKIGGRVSFLGQEAGPLESRLHHRGEKPSGRVGRRAGIRTYRPANREQNENGDDEDTGKKPDPSVTKSK